MLQDCKIDAPARADKAVMIFFHGLGACGQEMKDYVGAALAPHCPHLSMRFPDAPIERADAQGRSWFHVEDMLDNPDGNVAGPRALLGVADINEYIDGVLAEEQIAPERLLIAGFSQGATSAFFSALKRNKPVGAIFSISGGALDQLDEFHSRPPVTLLAGANEYSHYSGLYLVHKTAPLLENAGFEVNAVLTPENGHNIDQRSLAELLSVIQTRVPSFPALAAKPFADGFRL